MKLKKLEITGFKSFSDKTAINFPPGISAVVGPNGCGKSNIIDAIRWVMGEQSAKQLRGKSMEDIIFAGTNGNPPLNMAEVSLTLLNDNGSAPEELRDFTEIMLTRRVYRSGERSYFINKQPCRLKDIYNIFYGSGMGPKSYAVIQQGNIGAITDAGPEDRRYFIEEAAGVTRYKNRKTEALRKVNATNQNLLRLNDIIVELNRQMGGLKRQAKKAERFKRYQSHIRNLDIRVSLTYLDNYSTKLTETDAMLTELKDKDMSHVSQLKSIGAAVEDIKLRREEKNHEISTKKSEKFDKERRIDRMENDLAHYREDTERLKSEIESLASAERDLAAKNAHMIQEIEEVEKSNSALEEETKQVRSRMEREHVIAADITNRLKALQQQQESAKAELMDLVAQEARFKNIYQNASNNKDSVERRLKQTAEQVAVARKQIEVLTGQKDGAEKRLLAAKNLIAELEEVIRVVKRQLAENTEALGAQVKRTQTLEYDCGKLKSKHTALKKMDENFEWYRDGVKSIMKAAGQQAEGEEDGFVRSEGILGLVADILTPEPPFQTALEAVLGEGLQYILVDGEHTGADSIQYLQSCQGGRSGFIPVSSVKPVTTKANLPGDAANRLMDHVQVKSGYETLAQNLLGHVTVAESLQQAIDIFHRNGVYQTIVTYDGDLISAQGIMVGGSKDKLDGILAKKQEIRDLESDIGKMEAQIQDAQKILQELQEKVRDLETRLQENIEEKNNASQEEMEAEKALFKIEEELRQAGRRMEVLELEQEQLEGESQDLHEEMAKYTRAVTEIEDKTKRAQRSVAESTDKIQTVEKETAEHNQKMVDLKLSLTSVQAKMENNANTLRRLKEFREDGLAQHEQIKKDIEAKKRKADETKNQISRNEESLSLLYNDIQHLSKTLESHEAEYLAIDEKLKESDSRVAEIRTQREELTESIRVLELERAEKEIKRDHIVKRVTEQYQAPVPELKQEVAEKNENDDAFKELSVDKMEEKLSRYRDKAAKITDVNLGAIKEYEELKERHEFLNTQREDLIKAIDDLHKVIRKINKISQERFISTFNLINEKLNEVFPRLFEGGSAKLVLTEPDNPLETGVEFMVHPPGKKLTHLSLLSGGEKALSAIAFIFSIFLIRPTSFCLLDEIDAPLDEANVFRFNNLLQMIGEKSQVIMITHNKRSMEFADTLFGITMEKKGVSKVVSVNLD